MKPNMMNSLTLFFVSLQILLTAPGCQSSGDTWQEDAERDKAMTEELGDSPAYMCTLLRCPGLPEDQLRACQLRRCASFLPAAAENTGQVTPERRRSSDDVNDACVQRRCAGRRSFSLRTCALARCGAPRETRGRVAPPGGDRLSDSAAVRRLVALAKRGGGLKGLWPDEFETRQADRRALWPDEYETRDVERRRSDDNSDRAAEPEAEGDPGADGPALVRRARSDVSMEESAAGRGADRGKAGAGNEVKSVQKRWSTRLCMESHCKNAHSKVQYFMCGKAYCHR